LKYSRGHAKGVNPIPHIMQMIEIKSTENSLFYYFSVASCSELVQIKEGSGNSSRLGQRGVGPLLKPMKVSVISFEVDSQKERTHIAEGGGKNAKLNKYGRIHFLNNLTKRFTFSVGWCVRTLFPYLEEESSSI
jgi:hypothetical protein